ncbi:MAG TPA: DegT/DnrJ/EryC1/StrS family aminotransferase [Candidatus Acidoferrum sp.]|nr:DegT/DnrJ/EryC1/StrS family aminotransferase [Candidatus Acidoferrum sp.]
MSVKLESQERAIPLFKVFMAESAQAAVTRVLYSGYLGEGEEVASFERELAARLSVDRLVATNSGTSALHLACHIAVDGAADAEFITTPMTCAATNASIVRNGARIVWADIDSLSGNIDPDEIEPLITQKTRAIVMVHWGGNPCDIGRIRDLGQAHGIPVIEDAAQALGATYQGQPIGAHSDLVAFSFQAIKQVTSIDGGALVCKAPHNDARARLLRWYGIDREASAPQDLRCELDIEEVGYKFHMNNVSAAVGRENLKHLDWMLMRHRDNARFYDAAFGGSTTISVAPQHPDGVSACWLYTIHVANRDELMGTLRDEGIGASKVHTRNDTYSAFADYRRPLPKCEEFQATHLCIPVGWWVSDADRERVAECVIKFAR